MHRVYETDLFWGREFGAKGTGSGREGYEEEEGGSDFPPHPSPSNPLIRALRKILFICDTPVFHTNRKK